MQLSSRCMASHLCLAFQNLVQCVQSLSGVKIIPAHPRKKGFLPSSHPLHGGLGSGNSPKCFHHSGIGIIYRKFICPRYLEDHPILARG